MAREQARKLYRFMNSLVLWPMALSPLWYSQRDIVQ
jgi:hypothetical protein